MPDQRVTERSVRGRRIARFVAAGGVGFAVDAGILMLLVRAGYSPVVARIPSFATAVTITWLINRHFAFADRRAPKAAGAAGEYSRYVLSQLLGALLNLGIFAATLWLHPSWRTQPVLALALASACAMVFNYLAMHGFVFTHRAAVP